MRQSDKQLDELATYLRGERDRILRTWLDSVGHDPELVTVSKIPHAQFNDHIPQVLDAYERRLRAQDPREKRQARLEQRENAAEHGLLRWQQGYDQRETMREWGHLHMCLLRELEHYAVVHPGLDTSVMPTARATLVRLCAEGMCESASRYARLQQTEAAGRVQDLQRALSELTALEHQRVEMWREAAHDLRGSVGVISNASAILNSRVMEESTRTQFSSVLARSVASMRELLNDLIDLGRLEAGQEQRNVVPFDAAQLLKEFCDSMRVLTTQRNLFLKSNGPASLPVEGDPVKVRRIVQNLVLNALKVTESGGVQVSWQEHGSAGARQWMICVQDTGPGFDLRHAAPLERVLRQATTDSHELELRARLAGDDSADAAPITPISPQPPASSSPPAHGEGIGLSIVKRLCELLDASLELETADGAGTTFRIIFPRDYQRTELLGV